MIANFVSSSNPADCLQSTTTVNNTSLSSSNSTLGGGGEMGTSSQLGASTTTAIGGAAADVQKNNDENKRNAAPAYSMPGALHFIQHEWSRYELERAQWEMERAELKARISFLIGERKAQENLKHDLVRRIKMLEYALKQERAKHQQMLSSQQVTAGENNIVIGGGGGGDTADADQTTHFTTAKNSNVPMDIDALLPPPPSPPAQLPKAGATALNGGPPLSNQALSQARETLRQYLQEIGYSERILDVRSFRVKHLLGLLPSNVGDETKSGRAEGSGLKIEPAEKALMDSEDAILEAANAIKTRRGQGECGQDEASFALLKKSQQKRSRTDEEDSDSSSGGDDHSAGGGDGELDADAVEVFNEFAFLKKEGKKDRAEQQQQKEWESLDALKERLRIEQRERKRQQSLTSQGKMGSEETNINSWLQQQEHQPSRNNVLSEKEKNRNIAVERLSAELPMDEEDRFEAAAKEEDESAALQLRWNIRYTLRSHYDSIRAIQFHPVDPVFITASEDGTAKLWDLNHSSAAAIKGADGSGKSSQFPQPAVGILDVEPVYTFRGHRGPILALDMSPLGENCYTAGLDGVICCWNVPPTAGLDIYQSFDQNVLQERLQGHTDAIWALCYHSASNRLISASADGTICIWIVGLADGAMPSPLLKTIVEVDRPRSIDLVSTEAQQLVCACSKTQCHIRDFETGQIVVPFQMRENSDETPGEVNKILSHPTMPVTITAGEDRKIRYFDNNTGKLISSTLAHVEGVSALAIDPNGLYLLSGSHDGSMRLWNAERRICLQEIAAHRKQLDSGVMAVAFHPSRQLIGSAGADSLAKVYGTAKGSSPRGSVLATTSAGASGSSSPPSSASGSSGPSSLVGSPQKGSSPLKQQQQQVASSQL